VKRWVKRVCLTAVTVLALFICAALISGWRAFGHTPSGARLERMKHSPEWSDGHFVNPQPLRNDALGSVAAMFHVSPDVSPAQALETAHVDPRQFDTPPPGGLRLTWFGHSSVLIELDGARVLTDPIWSERASPLTWLGPKRFFPPPIPLDQLPPLDAVVVSHDHYDHLDYATLVALKDKVPRFIVPLGIGAHLEYWGVPADHIIELDWWEHAQAGPLEITAVPARHASGRTLVWDKDGTLWAGYALKGPEHRVYFSGDTGLFPAMADIGDRLGPFDVTLIETGQYHQAWPDWHIGPEQAVSAHRIVRGKLMLPVHWGLFALALHGWTEPVERVLARAAVTEQAVATPRPGESFGPEASFQRWWPALPFKTGAEDPIVSTQLKPGFGN
jgi:L-ascorbate metabolism protein UlaG (beta-lactamase superfamily)